MWIEVVSALPAVLAAGPDPGPVEFQVTGFDPAPDLDRRTGRWGHTLPSPDLGQLARFAAGLAVAEAEAWERDDSSVATRAFEDRRFLAGDRILHWAVPWLDAAGRCHGDVREPAHHLRDLLLDLGDRLRPVPDLTGGEGTTLPGHDSVGPVDPDRPLEVWIGSLLSGVVVMRATLSALRGEEVESRSIEPAWLSEPGFTAYLAEVYRVAAGRWQGLAGTHQGTARLWVDLAARATRTATLLEPRTV